MCCDPWYGTKRLRMFQRTSDHLRCGLGPSVIDAGPAEGSAEEVSRRILRTVDKWASSVYESDRFAERMAEFDPRNGGVTLLQGCLTVLGEIFAELVKRGASVTYCTTSAGDLEVLADATQSFHWAIIEEAGKAHGFDLALPLQAGHRSLLIADHKQPPPYRLKDYPEGIDFLESSVDALDERPQGAGGLLDIEWIQSWRDREYEQQEEFKEYVAAMAKHVRARLRILHRYVPGLEKRTRDRADGAAAGKLSHQHRMHPTIGDLVSVAYYDGDLVNRTVDERGIPLRRVRHALGYPKGIDETAIVWLDLTSKARDSDYSELWTLKGLPSLHKSHGGRRHSRFLDNAKGSGPYC